MAASRGREVRIMEEAMVSGRSGSWEVESGMALLLSAGLDGVGEDILKRCCEVVLVVKGKVG